MKTAMVMPGQVAGLIVGSLPVIVGQKRAMTADTKADYAKRARRGMIGMVLHWTDKNSFTEIGEITDVGVTHSNPTQRLIARDMWARCSEWICHSEFTWCVIMRVVFTGTEKGDKVDEYEFNYTCAIRGKKSEILEDAMRESLIESMKGNDAYPDGHRNKGQYKHCEFVAHIVGV